MDKVKEFFNSSDFTFGMCYLVGSLSYLDNHRFCSQSHHIGTATGVGVLTGLGGILFRDALPEGKHMVGVGAACIVGQSLYNAYDRWRYMRTLRTRSDLQVEDLPESIPENNSETESESTSNSDNESNSESSDEE